ncbi:MAG TPA: hypothetical protein VN428_00790 [Bryobacteraceae bacterium]|nr:hypothetical protein [Bryobacteraceae bacterium]
MFIGLAILLEPERGDPVTLAEVQDRQLLLTAAMEAIRAAEAKAHEWGAEDRVLGVLQAEEAARLRRALELVVPGLRDARGNSNFVKGTTEDEG